MELEELQKAWKELNERVTRNELVQKQQVIDMLSRQKESNLQKMIRADMMGILFFSGLFLFVFIQAFYLHNIRFWPFIVPPMLLVAIMATISICKLKQIEWEKNLEKQVKNILQYKSFMNWGFLIGYLSVIPLIVIFFIYYSNFQNILLFCVIFFPAVIIDYYQYHWFSDRIKEFSRTSKELAELKDELKQE